MPAKTRAPRSHHRRNPAATDINASNTLSSAIPSPETQQRNIDIPILSPNPISPIHQLRVTNSIPQLMKALPPLPDEPLQTTESPSGTSSSEAEVSTRLLLSSPVGTPAAVEVESSSSILALKSFSCVHNPSPSPHQQHGNPTRFKVRLRSSRSTGFQIKPGLDPAAVPKRSSSNPIKPRLRLKVSRNKMSQNPLSNDGTVVHNSDHRKYKSLLELKHFPQTDMLTKRSSFREALEEQLAQFGAEDKRLSSIDESDNQSQTHHLSDQFDIPYPPSLGRIAIATPVTQTRLESGSKVSRQRFSFDRARNPKRVKKRESFLRPRATLDAGIKKAKAYINYARERPDATTIQCWPRQLFR
ncbi:hypothetical protein NM208_g12402 [Fusarium decemcellulare]|uniref:Uncharacterized protein n=1 Tax=Fusarium decemcellulare TaxID=57161 RepID=A0ACC1RRC8_9HYPO|nr:hypothetical protein NM208_g12402 [Fusarium decemcellulare]